MANEPMKRSFSQGVHEATADKREVLGELRILNDGRKFRYAKAGGALAAGKMCIGAAVAANHINVSVAAAAIGARTVLVTVGATAVTTDAYVDGFLQVNDGTGEGYQYRIQSNTACDSAGTTIVTLAEPIRKALVASGTSQVSLVPNPWSSVTQSAVEESMAAGVAPVDAASGQYCWLQTGGPANVLQAGTGAVGSNFTLGAVAGSVSVISATIATTITQPIVGYGFGTAGVDTEYAPIWLTID